MSRHFRDDADQLPWFLDQLEHASQSRSGGRHSQLTVDAIDVQDLLDTLPLPRVAGARHALAAKGSTARREQHTVGAGRRLARVARRPLFVGVAAVVCFVVAGGAAVGSLSSSDESGVASPAPAKHVSIMIDGKVRDVSTESDTVRGALKSAGLSFGPHDTIAPGATSAIADGSVIVIDRGRPFTVEIDGRSKTIWTTADTVADALAEAGVAQPSDGSELRLSTNPSAPLPDNGLTVSGSTTRTVSWTVGGAPESSGATTARTVRALLAEKDIVLGPLDKVTPAPGTVLKPGMKVVVTRVLMATTTKRVTLAQPADIKISDAGLERGQVKVLSPGSGGVQNVIYKIITVNGRPVTTSVVGKSTPIPATAAVVRVGTKVLDPGGQQAADEAAAKFTYRGSEVFTHDTTFGVYWDGLAYCESTHNPKAVNANPSAGLPTYGLFQFDIPTWESVGGSGNPMDAGPSEQLMRAKLLYQQRGLEPWACRDSAHAPPPDA